MSVSYRKFEFCKAMGCSNYYPKNRFEAENCDASHDFACQFTAKEFMNYLKAKQFRIVLPPTFKAHTLEKLK